MFYLVLLRDAVALRFVCLDAEDADIVNLKETADGRSQQGMKTIATDMKPRIQRTATSLSFGGDASLSETLSRTLLPQRWLSAQDATISRDFALNHGAHSIRRWDFVCASVAHACIVTRMLLHARSLTEACALC